MVGLVGLPLLLSLIYFAAAVQRIGVCIGNMHTAVAINVCKLLHILC